MGAASSAALAECPRNEPRHTGLLPVGSVENPLPLPALSQPASDVLGTHLCRTSQPKNDMPTIFFANPYRDSIWG